MHGRLPAHLSTDPPRPRQRGGAPVWRFGPHWPVLLPVALTHVWTMAWLAWTVALPAGVTPPLPLHEALTWGCLVTAGVVAGGSALAWAPRRWGRGRPEHDRRARPRGRRWRLRLGAGLIGAAVALAAATKLGPASVWLAGLALAGLVFYRYAGRFFPAVAVVGTGLWHAVMMAVVLPLGGLAAVDGMDGMDGMSGRFLWPLILNATHVIALATLARATGIERPRLTARGGGVVCLGWAFLVLLLVGGMSRQHLTLTGEMRWMWIGPAAAVLAWGATAIVTLVRQRTATAGGSAAARREAVRRLVQYAPHWLVIYNAAWLLQARLWWPAGVASAILVVMLISPLAAQHMRNWHMRGLQYELP